MSGESSLQPNRKKGKYVIDIEIDVERKEGRMTLEMKSNDHDVAHAEGNDMEILLWKPEQTNALCARSKNRFLIDEGT